MNVAQNDALAARLRRVGNAGALPKNMTQAQLVDELQRQLGALADVNRALLTANRGGPRYTKDAPLFLVDCRAGGNLLTVAQATTEGLGAIAGLAVFRHGLGYKLDRAHCVHFALTPAVGVVNGQAARHGSCVLTGYDDNRTIFQVDQDAVTNGAVFSMSCYPSVETVSVNVNRGQNSKTGASTPHLGTIVAAKASGLP